MIKTKLHTEFPNVQWKSILIKVYHPQDKHLPLSLQRKLFDIKLEAKNFLTEQIKILKFDFIYILGKEQPNDETQTE